VYINMCSIKSSNTICKVCSIFGVIGNLRGKWVVERGEFDFVFVEGKNGL
jgi:hypothetical protein